MKRIKLLLLISVITISTVINAKNSGKIYDLNSLSSEIEYLLHQTNYNLEEGNAVTIFFSVSQDKTIQYIGVDSDDARVKQMLQKRLQDQQLDGEKWREGVIYELSIYGKTNSSVTCVSH